MNTQKKNNNKKCTISLVESQARNKYTYFASKSKKKKDMSK